MLPIGSTSFPNGHDILPNNSKMQKHPNRNHVVHDTSPHQTYG